MSSRDRLAAVRGVSLVALFAATLIHPASARASECRMFDPAHGDVTFEILDAGLPVRGRFRRFDGEVCLVDHTVTDVRVRLEPGSVDTGVPFFDAILRDEAFFGVAKHTYAAFTSDHITYADGARTVAHGILSLKDVTRPLDVPFALEDRSEGLTVSGALVFERTVFHVGTGVWASFDLLGKSVRVAFQARLSPVVSAESHAGIPAIKKCVATPMSAIGRLLY